MDFQLSKIYNFIDSVISIKLYKFFYCVRKIFYQLLLYTYYFILKRNRINLIIDFVSITIFDLNLQISAKIYNYLFISRHNFKLFLKDEHTRK